MMLLQFDVDVSHVSGISRDRDGEYIQMQVSARAPTPKDARSALRGYINYWSG